MGARQPHAQRRRLQRERHQLRPRRNPRHKSGKTILSASNHQLLVVHRRVRANLSMLQMQSSWRLVTIMTAHLMQAFHLHHLVNCVHPRLFQVTRVIWKGTLLQSLKMMASLVIVMMAWGALGAKRSQRKKLRSSKCTGFSSKCDEWRQTLRGTYLTFHGKDAKFYCRFASAECRATKRRRRT